MLCGETREVDERDSHSSPDSKFRAPRFGPRKVPTGK
jgi:hypothetical protein